MINLLPPQQKEEILQEENWKIVFMLGVLSLFFLLALFLFLTALKFYIAGETNIQKIITEDKEKKIATPQMRDLERNLVSFNKTLAGLYSFYQEKKDKTEILESIAVTLPSRAYLTGLSLTPAKNPGSGAILNGYLSGFAPSRASLLQFKANLEKSGRFKNVYFPPTNWVKQTDINFVVSFDIL